MPDAARVAVPALFISDLHLAEDRPLTTSAFLGFLDGPAREARSLFILGDLFEYWAGDDDTGAPFNLQICNALRALSATGTTIWFMTGNRDLLAGEGFARAAGLNLLPDPSLIQLGDYRILLSHGDALCTDDVAYQTYRSQVRDPTWQAGFLAQSLPARKAFIESLRKQSESAKREKAMTIMDVNHAAVEALLRETAYPTLIHGHTHRPAIHQHRIDGRNCERRVLADWHDQATWLTFDGQTFIGHGPASAQSSL